ncbi:MAG: CpXC domain-containing protein [Anaerovoracaceae bacterium]
MSKKVKQEVSCPNCGHKQNIEIWESVNVSLTPELKERILSHDFFVFECSECGNKMPLAYDCLYNDIKKHAMVWLLPDYSEELRREVNEAKTIEVDGKPFGNIYMNRIVETPNGLKEKIMIWDEGYDDRIIELLKLVYMSQLGQITGNEALMNEGITEMLFDAAEGKHSFVLFFEKIEPLAITMSEDVYIKLYEDFIEIAEHETPAGYFKVDYDWARKVFAKKQQ